MWVCYGNSAERESGRLPGWWRALRAVTKQLASVSDPGRAVEEGALFAAHSDGLCPGQGLAVRVAVLCHTAACSVLHTTCALDKWLTMCSLWVSPQTGGGVRETEAESSQFITANTAINGISGAQTQAVSVHSLSHGSGSSPVLSSKPSPLGRGPAGVLH